MKNLDEIKEKARQKVEAEMKDTDSAIGRIGLICLSWIDYADNAAELINQEGKTLDGAYKALRTYASKNRTGSTYCINPTKAMELILEYFGQNDSIGVVEGGLMYHCMMAATEKFKPYGTEPQKSGTDTPKTGTELPKTQPVAEKTKPLTALDVAVALGNVNLEDLGL